MCDLAMDQILAEVEESRLSPDVAEAIKAESGGERFGLDPDSKCLIRVTDQE